MPICPRECAGQTCTEVTTRESIEVPQDKWENLISKEYKIWRCDYCGFVWGEKLFVEAPGPSYHRAAIGYYGGRSGNAGWFVTPNEVLPNQPDYSKLKRRRR